MNSIYTIYLSERSTKYLAKEFENIPQPWKIDEGSLIGKLILGILTDKRACRVEELNTDDDRYPSTIELSDTLAKRSPTVLKLNQLDCSIELLFKASIEKWVSGQMAAGCTRAAGTESYLTHLGISQERNYSTVYQYISRKINRNYEKAQKKRGRGKV